MRELEDELVWGVSECCSKFRIDRGRVDESRDADPVEEPAWHGDEVSRSATTVVVGLNLVSKSAGALLRRGRVVVCGTKK